MSTSNGILALVADEVLRTDVDRVAAAIGARVVHVTEPSSRKVWAAASAVLLDFDGAARCARAALPRRGRIFVVSRTEPSPSDWPLAIAVGAQRILAMPEEEATLVSALSDATEAHREPQRRGAVLAVIGARGGAGASVFATALGHAATRPLLVDLDPWGGGIDWSSAAKANRVCAGQTSHCRAAASDGPRCRRRCLRIEELPCCQAAGQVATSMQPPSTQ